MSLVAPTPGAVSDTPAASATPLWQQLALMAVCITPLIVLCQIIAYWRTDVVDDQMFGYYGWRILHGARVYLDVWDNKPPGIYWVNALGFLVGADSYLGVIALCVVALLVAHAGFFIAAAAVYHRGAAALTTILLSFYLTHAYFTGGTNRTETFLVACELAAVAFYLRAFARERWWKCYLAGVLCGAAFLFKQTGLAAWGAMGLHLILLAVTRALPWRTAIKRGVLLVLGCATTLGLAALVLIRQGALHEALFASFGFNQQYFVSGASRWPYNIVSWVLLKNHFWPVMLLPVLMAVAALIHATLWYLRPQFRPPEIEAPLQARPPVCALRLPLFVVWFLTALYGALMSPHAFRHYLVPTIPPLLLIAGYLINVLRAETKLLRRIQQRAWVLAAFVAMGYFAWEAVRLQFAEFSRVWVDRVEQGQVAEWEAVGDAVAAVTRPEDRIQCWGYLPGAYLRARRINAVRFTTTEKVGQVRGGARFIVDEIEAGLRAAPPAVLAISSGDYNWMKGIDRRRRESEFTLAPWIDAHYSLAIEIPKFGTYYIFKRNDLFARDGTPRPVTTRPGS